MPELPIPTPVPFHFRDVVFSHGWLRLLPYQWDPESGTLARAERLADGSVVRLALREQPGGVALATDAPEAALPELERRVRWMLALDDELSGFHGICQGEPGLQAAAERGKGRILRCPTLWEEVVKTLFSVNTTWSQTIAMTRNLVDLCGEPHPAGEGRTFPTPQAVAEHDVSELQRICRVGYRAAPLHALAQDLASGTLDLEALKEPTLPTEEVEARLRSLRGIGPYAAANVLLLLGRYDHLPVDSWFRKTIRNAWFHGEDTPDRDLVSAFDRFRPYRALVYYFYDWEGANRPEVWHDPWSEAAVSPAQEAGAPGENRTGT